MRMLLLLAIITATNAADVATLDAQTQCRAADEETQGRISSLTEMMTSTDSRWINTREAYQLPVVADTAIQVVTDSAVCAQAATAYNAALPEAARINGRSVYVVRVGTTRYVVWDVASADDLEDEFEIVVVLDSSFTVLGKFAS